MPTTLNMTDDESSIVRQLIDESLTRHQAALAELRHDDAAYKHTIIALSRLRDLSDKMWRKVPRSFGEKTTRKVNRCETVEVEGTPREALMRERDEDVARREREDVEARANAHINCETVMAGGSHLETARAWAARQNATALLAQNTPREASERMETK